jgi:Mrp family chromosome partitioning ATPase
VDPVFSAPPLPPWIFAREQRSAARRSPELVMLQAPECVAAQQFRALRYKIEQLSAVQFIAVVSPRRGDGASVTAANLALAFAEGDRVRVLLIDVALRTPRQAELFGLASSPGLTGVLAARADNPYAPVELARIGRSLFVLPAGCAVGAPHAVLASEAAAGLLSGLRRAFRYIVVDASPVLGSAEMLAWHRVIDGYVLVARRGVTSTDDLGRAADRLNRDKVIGVTLVGVSSRRLES